MKYEIALVIGRFQPFHKGHLHLVKQALKNADKIIIAIGSSNIHDANNPLSYAVRKQMLEKVIQEEKIENRVLKIVPSPDDPSDDIWLKELLTATGEFDIALGDNSWTNGILKKAGYKTIEDLYYMRHLYEGYKIRKLFKEGRNWQSRVPKYLVVFVSKNFADTL